MAYESYEVVLGPISHGGSCVARLPGQGAGRVVFVRGGIPGERVKFEVIDASREAWWRGRVTAVIDASPDRVTPVCPVAGICGGCDFQHIDLARQRRLKADLVMEQLRRVGRVEPPAVVVEPVAGDDNGLAWRTRMRYLVRGSALGLRAQASHALVPLPPEGCPLAAPSGLRPADLVRLRQGAGAGRDDEPDAQIGVTVASSGVSVWVPGGNLLQGDEVVVQQAGGVDFQVRADGFWQVHPGAASALLDATLSALSPQPGERALDLYCGVGLFAAGLKGRGATVSGVEASPAAIGLARRNVPGARFQVGAVERFGWRRDVDVVVLDPPRAGAGRRVINQLVAGHPRAIVYVACEPASLARDVATLTAGGYQLRLLRAFDIFPMTAHVECVALFEPVHRVDAG